MSLKTSKPAKPSSSKKDTTKALVLFATLIIAVVGIAIFVIIGTKAIIQVFIEKNKQPELVENGITINLDGKSFVATTRFDETIRNISQNFSLYHMPEKKKISNIDEFLETLYRPEDHVDDYWYEETLCIIHDDDNRCAVKITGAPYSVFETQPFASFTIKIDICSEEGMSELAEVYIENVHFAHRSTPTKDEVSKIFGTNLRERDSSYMYSGVYNYKGFEIQVYYDITPFNTFSHTEYLYTGLTMKMKTRQQ